MLLPFDLRLIATGRFDQECRALADRHYSRQKPGTPQFSPPGELLILRDACGDVVLAFIRQRYRKDGQRGVYCSIFRNESARLSSAILLESEATVRVRWGAVRLFTFIDPAKVKSPNPGYCFKMAGWQFEGINPKRQHILAKILFAE